MSQSYNNYQYPPPLASQSSGMATAGLALGYINLALTIVGICFAVLVFTGLMATPLCLAPFANSFNP